MEGAQISGRLDVRQVARALLPVLVAFTVSASAQETDRWRFRQVQLENDVFWVPYSQPGDRFYTNGMRVSFGNGVYVPGADESRMPAWLRPVRKHCAGCLIFPNFSIGQQIYTPEDIARWAGVIRAQTSACGEVFVYFKHEESGKGPEFGRMLMERLSVQEN